MVGIPDVIVHKSDTSVSEGRGGKDKKVSIIEVLENKTRAIIDNDGIDAFSMEVSTMGRTCSIVVDPFGS